MIPPVYTPGTFSSVCKAFIKFELPHQAVNQWKNTILVSSGRAALAIALEVLKQAHPGKTEVIVPAYTCPSVADTVMQSGLDIVLSDIEVNSFSFELAQLERKITNKTLAVVAQHLFGIGEDVRLVLSLAKLHNVAVIEDYSQALGADFAGRPVGTDGDLAFTSFGLGKMTTAGLGGMVTANNERYAKALLQKSGELALVPVLFQLRTIVSLLLYPALLSKMLYWMVEKGPLTPEKAYVFRKITIWRMPRLFRIILSLQLVKIPDICESRRQRGIQIIKAIEGSSLHPFHYCKDNKFLRLPCLYQDEQSINSLCSNGLGLSRMYRKSLDQFKEIRYNNTGDKFPNAETVAARLLTLPVHSRVKDQDVNRILKII